MSGPPEHRHQIEFPDAIAQFFTDIEREKEIISVRIKRNGPDWPRPLTYRGTDYGQWTEIWRLGLLTAQMGGPTYAGRVIRLERLAQGANKLYRLYVADEGSPEAATWRASSGATTSTTGGPLGRAYGYW